MRVSLTALAVAALLGCPSSGSNTTAPSATPSPSGTVAPRTTPSSPTTGGSSAKPPLTPPSTQDPMVVMANPKERAIARGAKFANFKELFNRYYTEPSWAPTKTIWVSPNGNGDGSQGSPASPKNAVASAKGGTKVIFTKGNYVGCYGIEGEEQTGTYDAPIVIYGERNADGSRGVKIQCCNSGRKSCFNFEGANYVAVDGIEMRGGLYGVRAVGIDYNASSHSKGIVVVNSLMDAQSKDGVLTGASDWDIFENNIVSSSGVDDGHGIYLSNGSDFNIVRNNDLFGNHGATFQINADPLSCCDPDTHNEGCDALAGTGEGGRGASDYMLVENNYFHHGHAQGSNFTSVRHSVVRNNVFAAWGKHGVNFWSETADATDKQLYNPKLGSHHNKVLHNLFVSTNDKHMLQFINNSDHCEVKNNLFVGLTVKAGNVSGRPGALLMETDPTVKNNIYDNNVYIAGKFDGRNGPTSSETLVKDFNASWFARLPAGLPSTVSDFQPKAGAPFLDKAPRLPAVGFDRDGKPRGNPADVGPFEL